MITSDSESKIQQSPSKYQTSKPKSTGRVAALRRFFEEKTAATDRSQLSGDLNFLLQNTNFTEQQIRQWFSEFIKACPSGQIDKTQFAMFYKQLDPVADVTDKFCCHMFRCFDRDNSGYIDFKEFLIALNVKRTSNPETKLKWVFRLYDIDGNGTIDLMEMTRVVETIFEMMSPDSEEGLEEEFNAKSCAAAVFQNIDANDDGQLSEDEFLSACKKDKFLYTILTSASMI